MKLLNYLNEHFYSLEQLLEPLNITLREFRELQKNRMMPACSYCLSLDLRCHSYFGEHMESSEIEYYAKGYQEWLMNVLSKTSKADVFELFSSSYRAQLTKLHSLGFHSQLAKFNGDLSLLLKEEWEHFISGTYGLCTKTGLPKDIASKEMAISTIESLTKRADLNTSQRQYLGDAVALLDKSSSLFAPHERAQSSRYRLIDQVREKYNL